MANNPHTPPGQHDPAGSTQMFRAFVDEGVPPQTATERSGSRAGLIIGVMVAVAIVAVVAWFATG